MKIKSYLFFLLFSILTQSALATSMEDARNQGLNFGGTYKDSAGGIINDQNKLATPGYKTDNPEETKYFNSGGSMQDDALAKTRNSAEGKLMTESLPNRPQIKVSANDPFLKNSNKKAQDEALKMLTGTYEECKAVSLSTTDSEIRTCDEYENRDGGSCQVPQEVEVKAEYNYSCTKERNYTDKTCNKTLSIICDNSSSQSCNSVGIIPVDGVSYDFTTLKLYFNWTGGSCSQYTRTLNFNISDINQIAEFRLSNITYDDLGAVRINGQTVYNDTSGASGKFCERARNSGGSPNIDLKPYLKVGTNKVEFILYVAGMGWGEANFLLKQNCCNNPQEIWEETCQ
jgi:hypothetical protein